MKELRLLNVKHSSLEWSISSSVGRGLWGFSVTRFDYNGAEKSHDLL